MVNLECVLCESCIPNIEERIHREFICGVCETIYSRDRRGRKIIRAPSRDWINQNALNRERWEVAQEDSNYPYVTMNECTTSR